jgi:hypothetical protein
MAWLKSEEEVDVLIADMVSRSKGRYITQGVTFNKSCPRQMGLLKKALMSSASFSGLGKEMLALRFSSDKYNLSHDFNSPPAPDTPKKNTGNFL